MKDVKLGKYQHYKGKFYEVIGVARHRKFWKNWLYIALFMIQKSLAKMLYRLDQNQCFLKMLALMEKRFLALSMLDSRAFFQLTRLTPRVTLRSPPFSCRGV